MGINSFSEITQCTKKCDCRALGNLMLKEDETANMNTSKIKEKKNYSRNNKDNIKKIFFTNPIKEYLNDSNNEINISYHNNNIRTYRSTNIQTNSTVKNNNNENNNCNISNNNFLFNKNNVTTKENGKIRENNSIYSNKDSFIKMEKKEEENENKFDKSISKFSIIEQSLSLSNNKDLDNVNIEDLMDLMELKNIEINGTIIENNGERCIFKGQLEDKKNICGKGTIFYKNGRKYEGIFENGKLNGKGKYIASNGDIYEGIFDKGNLSGKGKITRFENKEKKNPSLIQEDSTRYLQDKDKPNKIEFEGEIKDYKKEGKGREKSDEYEFEGNYHNDMKNGLGKITYLISGDKYEGEFKNDTITGHGKYIWNNKSVYIGEFLEGKMHGRGIYKWPEGNEYEGEYKNNIKEGKGRFKWKNGVIFDGNFLGGKPHGKGELIYKNKKESVEYDNGNLKGNFKEIINRLMKE